MPHIQRNEIVRSLFMNNECKKLNYSRIQYGQSLCVYETSRPSFYEKLMSQEDENLEVDAFLKGHYLEKRSCHFSIPLSIILPDYK